MNGVANDTTREELIRRFGAPKSDTTRDTRFRNGTGYVELNYFVDGTRTVNSDRFEIGGREVARAGDGTSLAAVEQAAGQKAKRIAEEHDAVWFQLGTLPVTVAVGTHGSLEGDVLLFSMRCNCGR